MSDELDPYPGNMKRHEVRPFLSIQETKDILSDTPLKMYSREQLERMVGEVRGVYEAERARLIKENEALRKQMLTAEVFTRVVEWLKDPQRKTSQHGLYRWHGAADLLRVGVGRAAAGEEPGDTGEEHA